MTRSLLALSRALTLGCLLATAASAAASPARDVVRSAADAMGGEAKLRAIHDVHLKTIGSWSSVEASERPEPPWNINYDQGEQWLDFQRGAWREDVQFMTVGGVTSEWKAFSQIAADGVSAFKLDGPLKAGAPVYLADATEQLLYQPYRLVLAALDAPDLRADGTTELAGQPIQLVAFHHAGLPIRLWVDARTHRLAVAEVTHAMPDDSFWRMRGDVHDRLVFSQWLLHPSGIWFARQYDLIRQAIPYHTFAITMIEPNVATAATFAIPDEIRADYKANARGPASIPARGEKPLAELAPGVWLAPAGRNALIIAQPAGALLVDAPVSDVYVGRKLDEVQRLLGKPVANVVLSDHITPQLSGLREAAARGVTLRALDANRGFVDSLLAAPHTLEPDTYARGKHSAKVEPITQRTALGDGPTRAELIPMRGSRGERIVLVWLPAPRLLWIASAVTLDADGHADPSRLAELDAAVAREHLAVAQVVGASLPATGWAALHGH